MIALTLRLFIVFSSQNERADVTREASPEKRVESLANAATGGQRCALATGHAIGAVRGRIIAL
jgi:hypothetical protein